jgi:NADH-quinone oxidoreductase subunit N
MTLALFALFSVALTLLGFFVPVPVFKRLVILGLSFVLLSLLSPGGSPSPSGPTRWTGFPGSSPSWP